LWPSKDNHPLSNLRRNTCPFFAISPEVTMRFQSFGRLFLLALSVLATSASAQPTPPAPAPPALDNMDFEQGDIGKSPPGWFGRSITTSDDKPQGGAKSLLLCNDGPTPANFARGIPAAPFRGQYIRFRAAVRTTSPAGAGLWLRIDGPQGKMLFLDNTSDRLVHSSDWTWMDIKVYVPTDAEHIVLGGLIFGAGTAGFDTANLEILPASIDPITPAAQAYLDRALDILQAQHINRYRVDWPVLRTKAHAAAAHAQTPADTYDAIRLAIGELGEKHTFLLPHQADLERLIDGTSPVALKAEALGEHVVELTLPGIADPIGAEYIETLKTAITQHERAGACGWIVDLRNDTGGNAWAMLRGLTPLLGPAPWGAFRDADGKLQIWTLRDGVAVAVPVQAFPKTAKGAAPSLQPIAVLIGPHTASAGEMTAIALAGRANARSFGAPTASLTTANGLVGLSDGAAIVLTMAYELDRTGKLVEGPLQPDQPTAPDQTEPTALTWLASKGCH